MTNKANQSSHLSSGRRGRSSSDRSGNLKIVPAVKKNLCHTLNNLLTHSQRCLASPDRLYLKLLPATLSIAVQQIRAVTRLGLGPPLLSGVRVLLVPRRRAPGSFGVKGCGPGGGQRVTQCPAGTSAVLPEGPDGRD